MSYCTHHRAPICDACGQCAQDTGDGCKKCLGDKEDFKLGERLADVLRLRRRKKDGRYLLGEGYGTKTAIGVARTLRTIITGKEEA